LIVLLWTIALSCPFSASAASTDETDFWESKEIGSNYFTDLKTVVHKVEGGTMDGVHAYCLQYQFASPKGLHYTKKLSVDKNIKYCLRYGYPNNSSEIAGKPLETATEAYLATKLAIWRSSQDSSDFVGVPISLSGLHPKNAAGKRVLAAGIALYNKAKSGYSVPKAPSHPKPTFTLPSAKEKAVTPDKKRIKDYTVAGPFSASIPTASHIEDAKFTAKLSGAPSGSYIGNASGTKISNFVSATKYYVYIPTNAKNLSSPGSTKVTLTASYSYQYETEFKVTAFSIEHGQNMAVTAKPSFASETISANANFDVTWTSLELVKIDTKKTPIPDTEFELAYKVGTAWTVLGKATTDKSGKIKWPGLGLGDYRLTETRPNPDFSSPDEFGESNAKLFTVASTSSPMVQTFINTAITTGCEVDIDTINLTSAAYRSLPDEEDFDNVDNESYHYDLDYRSLANVFADEFVVDDSLDGVKDGLIRVNTLWTAVSWGDADGKMNVWYKTNLTDSKHNYSNLSAMSTNPTNPNNPSKKPVYPNTGYKLWASNVSTASQTRLDVSNLALEDGEYITAIRYEHGKVNRGFTTRNYLRDTKNQVSHDILSKAVADVTSPVSNNQDWTPNLKDASYSKEAKAAKGLCPVTYLVTCPNPLDSSTLIVDRVTANIARNIVLTDQDDDIVGTYPIETFTMTPKADPVKFEHKVYGIENYEKMAADEEEELIKEVINEITEEEKEVINEIAEEEKEVPKKIAEEKKEVINEIAEKEKVAIVPKTTDGFPIVPVLIACFGALLTGILIVLMRGKLKHFKVMCMVMAVATAGMFTLGTVSVFADNNDDTGDTKEFTYTVNGEIDTDSYDNSDGEDSFEPEIYIDNGRYTGIVYLTEVNSTPNYKSFERKVDKTKVYSELDEEEVLYLPNEADFELTTDESIDSKATVSLKRAGLKLEITDEDSLGIPCEWEATAVFRGLEQYLDVHSYSSEAVYVGELTKK
jgi:hypothetical protein